MQQGAGEWQKRAKLLISIVRKDEEDRIAEARARGDVICDVLTPLESLQGFPKPSKGSLYQVFVEAEDEIRVCFVDAEGANPEDVYYEAALGMKDNHLVNWR